jgi:hypothetical protein
MVPASSSIKMIVAANWWTTRCLVNLFVLCWCVCAFVRCRKPYLGRRDFTFRFRQVRTASFVVGSSFFLSDSHASSIHCFFSSSIWLLNLLSVCAGSWCCSCRRRRRFSHFWLAVPFRLFPASPVSSLVDCCLDSLLLWLVSLSLFVVVAWSLHFVVALLSSIRFRRVSLLVAAYGPTDQCRSLLLPTVLLGTWLHLSILLFYLAVSHLFCFFFCCLGDKYHGELVVFSFSVRSAVGRC